MTAIETTAAAPGMGEFFKTTLSILFTMIFVNNYILHRFLGICPFLGVSKKLDSAVGMSAAVIFVMVMASAITWPIQIYVLDANGIGYLQIAVFILVIAALVQLVEIICKRFVPPLYEALGVYLPLITTNCAILGVTVLNISDGLNFIYSIVNSLGAGLGFMMAMVLFAGVRERIEGCDPPKAFRGIPITLVSAAIMSIAFSGLTGVAAGIFGA